MNVIGSGNFALADLRHTKKDYKYYIYEGQNDDIGKIFLRCEYDAPQKPVVDRNSVT